MHFNASVQGICYSSNQSRITCHNGLHRIGSIARYNTTGKRKREMQNAVARYLEELEKHFHDNRKITRRSISRFDDFQSLNSCLITRALETEGASLWVGVNPASVHSLYEVALYTLAVHFFRLNHTESSGNSPRKGDKYQKGKNIFEVIDPDYTDDLGYTGIKLKAINCNRSDLTTKPTLEYLNERYTPLTTNANITATSFEPILKLFREAMGQKVNLPPFRNKFAIIVARDQFEHCFEKTDRKAYPYVHLGDQGWRSRNPEDLGDNLFYIAHCYEDIKAPVLEKGIELDVVAFFGKSIDAGVLDDIDRKHVKRVIAIGPERPERPDMGSLLCWQWTPPELTLLQKTEPDIPLHNLNGTQFDSGLIEDLIAEMSSSDRKELSGITFPPEEQVEKQA